MNFKFSQRSLKNLKGVHPNLVAVAHEALARSSVDFIVTEGLRTKARQAELVKAGASWTMHSKHITGDAIDVVAWIGGVRWELPPYYRIAEAFRDAAASLGVNLRWGGAWVLLTPQVSPQEAVERYAERRRREGKSVNIDAPHFEILHGR